MVKTHLIIKDIHDEYNIKWKDSILNCDPLLENGKPTFIIISSTSRIELNTIDIKTIEEYAKRIATPKGRKAITSDTSYIYIKSKDNTEKLIGKVKRTRIKKFAPMYDAIGWKE